MIRFPNSKINLGLHVTSKRADGFHDIETIFYPVPLCDALEIIPAPDRVFQFDASGLPVEGEPAQNLCVKAYHLLKSTFGLPAVRMHLHKMIPAGSGLGGGSADGAFTLMMLNDLFRLDLSHERLRSFAGALGSDCAFFIDGDPAFASGKGDRLEPSEVDLSGMYLVLVVPEIRVATPDAYRMVVPAIPGRSLQEVTRLPVTEWNGALNNDFEKPIFEKFPMIGEIKGKLYEAGAAYASMSGSRSAVYGLFDEMPHLPAFDDCFSWQIRIT